MPSPDKRDDGLPNPSANFSADSGVDSGFDSSADSGVDSGVDSGAPSSRRPRLASTSLRRNATRNSLALAAQRRLGFSQSESRRLVDDIFATLSDFLLEHGRAKVSSFGSFSVRRKVARVGRNPRTGEVVPIAPRRVVSFRASTALRERLKGDGSSGKGRVDSMVDGRVDSMVDGSR